MSDARTPVDDAALDRLLARQQAPAMPAGLADRIVAEAQRPDRPPAAAPTPWRRRSPGRRWTRNGVLAGVIAVNLIIASAVAAAFGGGGALDVTRIAAVRHIIQHIHRPAAHHISRAHVAVSPRHAAVHAPPPPVMLERRAMPPPRVLRGAPRLAQPLPRFDRRWHSRRAGVHAPAFARRHAGQSLVSHPGWRGAAFSGQGRRRFDPPQRWRAFAHRRDDRGFGAGPRWRDGLAARPGRFRGGWAAGRRGGRPWGRRRF